MAEQVRVLIVDDSAFVRRAVARMLGEIPEIVIAGTASTGAEAVRKVRTLRPDVVLLDVNMPELDGIEALRAIMAETPTPVLMLSTHTHEGARTAVLALELGAVDFLDKTSAGTTMDIYALGPVLREKVLAVAGASVPVERPAQPEPIEPAAPPIARPCAYDLLVIGASTGGPRALAEVLGRLPADFPLGVVVGQHMPEGFTETLAERLDRRAGVRVLEAQDHARIEPGTALLAPGGMHTTIISVEGNLHVRVSGEPAHLLHRPSIDLLFGSAAQVAGSRAIGVILTGMGDDGARGLEALRAAGARTLAESAETAVIFGMPRAAAPAAERVLPLREIAPALIRLAAGNVDPESRS